MVGYHHPNLGRKTATKKPPGIFFLNDSPRWWFQSFIFYIYPRIWGRIPILTSIYFNWAGPQPPPGVPEMNIPAMSFGIEAMATEPNFPLTSDIFEKIMGFSRDD